MPNFGSQHIGDLDGIRVILRHLFFSQDSEIVKRYIQTRQAYLIFRFTLACYHFTGSSIAVIVPDAYNFVFFHLSLTEAFRGRERLRHTKRTIQFEGGPIVDLSEIVDF